MNSTFSKHAKGKQYFVLPGLLDHHLLPSLHPWYLYWPHIMEKKSSKASIHQTKQPILRQTNNKAAL
jgi:hypothetical protein